jgi:hypothetical protein
MIIMIIQEKALEIGTIFLNCGHSKFKHFCSHLMLENLRNITQDSKQTNRTHMSATHRFPLGPQTCSWCVPLRQSTHVTHHSCRTHPHEARAPLTSTLINEGA